MEAVGSFPFRHPRATAEVAGTEIIGLGPEDPAADVAAGAEIAVAEDAAVAAAKEAAERAAEAAAKEARESATAAAHETDNELALYKAPAPGRDAVPELTKGFNPKNYPGDGPYLALDKHIAKRFQSHYRNRIQKFTISNEDFKRLSESGVIRSDTHYKPGELIHVPANSLEQFNQAILRGSPNT